MTPIEALLAGASVGVTVAAPIGPMAIVVIRRTLAGGFCAGIATGAGASTITLVYSCLALGGLHELAPLLSVHRAGLHATTAAVLVVLALRTLFLSRTTARPDRGPASAARLYVSAIAFNAANPLGFVLLTSATAAFTGLAAERATVSGAMAAGVFMGSIAWWLVLVATVATVGIRLSPNRTRLLDGAAALVLVGFAASALTRL